MVKRRKKAHGGSRPRNVLPLVSEERNIGIEFDDEYLDDDEIEKEGKIDDDKLLRVLKEQQNIHNFSSHDKINDVFSISEYSPPPSPKEKEDKFVEEVNSDFEVDEKEQEYDALRQWGKESKRFYGGNERIKIGGGGNENEENLINDREIELRESEILQFKHLEQLDEKDFAESFFDNRETANLTEENEIKNEILTRDVSRLSKKERMALFQMEAPEFEGITLDFRSCLSEAISLYRPILEWISQNKIPSDSSVASYVRLKYNLILNYCTNISCYIMFKSSRLSCKYHGMTKRLIQYKQLLESLKPFDDLYKDSIINLIRQVSQEGKKIEILVKKAQSEEVTRHRNSELRVLTTSRHPLVSQSSHQSTHRSASKRKLENDSEAFSVNVDASLSNEENESSFHPSEEDEEKRRSITYQMAKNKGLAPKRSKLQRNPRVKHRHKFDKAKIRRKGQVREVRKEVRKYEGEIFGINARVKKGIKLQ